ncbi:hypothetical protein B1P84_13365 [Enterococcus faecium]|nr:hypothetical protein B1P84_13365 [Enterococcus faecium]
MTFLDLFAGIGGFRLGMEQAGHQCIGFCEIDEFARRSYKAIHDTRKEVEMHDITSVSDEFVRSLGPVDILCGGFPCQAFSIAGKRQGFSDTRGTLFFEIARFATLLQPKFLFLENVRGLLNLFEDCLKAGGVMKRLDLAINDRVGLLDIPDLTKKCQKEECISLFRTFKSYRSGELLKADEKDGMGNTLYIGSLKSEVYFCLYEKDYEQYIKLGIPLDQTETKNRFEIRLKNDRAYYAIQDLLKGRSIESTTFSIINRYLRFADKVDGKRRTNWPLNEQWGRFIGRNRKEIQLTSEPKPYTIERTLNWLGRQVAPTWKMAKELDRLNQTTYIQDMVQNARLSDRHKKILEQQSMAIENLIV